MKRFSTHLLNVCVQSSITQEQYVTVAHIHSLFWHSSTHTHTHSPPATPPQLTTFLSLRPSTSGIVQEASWKPLPLAPEHSQRHCLKRKTRLFTFGLSSQTILLAFSAVILVCWCWCAAVCYFCSLATVYCMCSSAPRFLHWADKEHR